MRALISSTIFILTSSVGGDERDEVAAISASLCMDFASSILMSENVMAVQLFLGLGRSFISG